VEHLKALPEPVRRYIHDLSARCDPAGDVATLAIQRETIAAGTPSGRGSGVIDGMYTFASDGPGDLEGIRARLRSMSKDALLRYSRAVIGTR
jgi:hypothetical protein